MNDSFQLLSQVVAALAQFVPLAMFYFAQQKSEYQVRLSSIRAGVCGRCQPCAPFRR